MTLRLLSYNIRHGGVGRVEAIAAVIRGCAPDVVVLQEATRPGRGARARGETGLRTTGRTAAESLGFLSRVADREVGVARGRSCRAMRSST